MTKSYLPAPLFDPDVYRVDKYEPGHLEFFRKTTGIDDETELKEHLVGVSKEAYETQFPYPCIWLCQHFEIAVALHPSYPTALAQCQPSSPRFRPDHVFLDVGACFGIDIRKVVFDGWEADRAFATDLRQGLIDYGYTLFRDSPTTCPITFIAGDMFSDAFFDPSKPPPPSVPARALTDLSSFLGKVTAIYAGFFFHLFDKPVQLVLAKRLASLLNLESSSADKPSIIFGRNRGSLVPGGETCISSNGPGFEHGSESWTKLWTAQVYGERKENVGVRVWMRPVEKMAPFPPQFSALGFPKAQIMDWAVEIWKK